MDSDKDNPHADADLHDALIAWQGGELPAGRTDALLEQLRVDASFRQALADRVWTLSLTRVAQSPDPRWLPLHEELGLTTAEHGAGETDAFEGAVMRTIQAEGTRFVPAWWRLTAVGSALAALALAVGVAWWTLRPSTADAARSSGEMLAVLVQTDDVQWDARQTERPQDGSALSAGPLKLSSGRATLLFTSGVVLEMEGPADVDLLAVDRVLCRAGRLRSNVPDGAEGFCIETPGGAVTDLGTEMGVSVTPDGRTHVTVFEGEAELSSSIPGQTGVRSALLGKADTASLVPDTGEIVPSSPATFLDSARIRLPALRLGAHYDRTILSARPRHYWRINREEAGVIPNEVPDGPPLRKGGWVRLEEDEHGRTSARFAGRRSPGALYLAEPWMKPADACAVEMWIAPDTVELSSLVAFTAEGTRRQHVSLVEIGSRRPGHGAETGVVRYLTRWPAGHRGGMNIYAAPTTFPYQWHHLVAQQKGRELQLYIDGKPAGTALADQPQEALACMLQFGCLEYTPDADLSQLQRLFSGRMAEVAVYDRLLTAAEIQARQAGQEGP